MAVTINEGNITYDGQALGVKADPDGGDGVFTDYMVHNHYDRDGGVYAAGLTSPDPYEGETTAVVKLRNATLIWFCEWTACRMGTLPLIPDPNAMPPGWRLLDIVLNKAMQSLGPSGSDPIWRISGVYIYACKKPNANIFSDAVFPVAPWVKPGVFPRKIPFSKLAAIIATDQGSPQPAEVGTSLGVVDVGQGKQGIGLYIAKG